MDTTIYLIRHSEPLNVQSGSVRTIEPLLLKNEKTPLSINGEKIAERYANTEEFTNLNLVYSSNYVRAMSTAKYFAGANELMVNVDDRFNERIHGVDSWSDLSSDFGLKQFEDENYKVGFGESQKEVQTRMYEALCEILKEYQGKRIAIVSHSTAMAFLLKKWCKVYYDKAYTYDDSVFFDGKWHYLETFKLIFDSENNIRDIKNVRM